MTMPIIERMEDFSDLRTPLVLTIGNFDGMHRGHVALLNKMKELAGSEGQIAVLTFRNHPSTVLRPEHSASLLSSLPHKLRLLEQEKVDHIILLTFTRYFANHSAASFIETVKQTIPFSHLVLGYDATLGRDKRGDRSTLSELGDIWGFTPYYLDEYRYEGKTISSSQIRKAVQSGNLQEAETMLGRPYSILAPVLKEHLPQEKETIQLDVSSLCLPPPGIYPIDALIDRRPVKGTALLTEDRSSTHQNATLKLDLPKICQPIDAASVEVLFHYL